MMKRALISLALALPLAGCISFGEPAPKSLMTLSSSAQAPTGVDRTTAGGGSLVVIPPVAAPALQSNRVVVHTTDTEIAYLADAQWSDEPSRLFAGLLAESIAARTPWIVLDRRQFALSPGARLTGQLHAFGLDAPRGEVVVRYDAALDRGGGTPLLTRRFEARLPTPSEQAGTVGPVLNNAANQVAVQVADWVNSVAPVARTDSPPPR